MSNDTKVTLTIGELRVLWWYYQAYLETKKQLDSEHAYNTAVNDELNRAKPMIENAQAAQNAATFWFATDMVTTVLLGISAYFNFHR